MNQNALTKNKNITDVSMIRSKSNKNVEIKSKPVNNDIYNV